MKYNEIGFRALYQNFCVLPLTGKYKEELQSFPGGDQANCMLVYGYIEQEAGLTLDVVALGTEEDGKYKFFDPLDQVSYFIRIRAVEQEDFVYLADEMGSLQARYKNKIESLKFYNTNPDVEETRNMGFLDASRNPYHPDEVQVCLVREGYTMEQCYTRIKGLSDHGILGTLIDEPKQDFGCHQGEEIAFFVQELQNKRVVCYADMTPTLKLTAEDLADGSMLKNAIALFHEKRNKANYMEILNLLRDSKVWIPYNEQQGISDILRKGEDYFYPVFSSEAEMGQYGVHFTKVQKSFIEVIELARKNEKNVTGIVLNPFTQSFLLECDLFEMIGELKSRLING